MDEAKKRNSNKKKEKWVKVFQVFKNKKHLYKQLNYQFFLPSSTPRLPEGTKTTVARKQLPCIPACSDIAREVKAAVYTCPRGFMTQTVGP